MCVAARRAGEDADAPALVRRIGRVAVPHGSWHYADPGRVVAERLGVPRAETVLVATGIPQQTLFDDAYAAIRDGRLDAVLIVGGEAARRAAVAARARGGATAARQEGAHTSQV